MPKNLGKGVPFSREKYDWDTWFSGDQYRLQQGYDYFCKSLSFARAARIAAYARNFRLEVYIKRYPVVDGEVNFEPDPSVDYRNHAFIEFVYLTRKEPTHINPPSEPDATFMEGEQDG
jgi:hypothetical protein